MKQREYTALGDTEDINSVPLTLVVGQDPEKHRNLLLPVLISNTFQVSGIRKPVDESIKKNAFDSEEFLESAWMPDEDSPRRLLSRQQSSRMQRLRNDSFGILITTIYCRQKEDQCQASSPDSRRRVLSIGVLYIHGRLRPLHCVCVNFIQRRFQNSFFQL